MDYIIYMYVYVCSKDSCLAVFHEYGMMGSSRVGMAVGAIMTISTPPQTTSATRCVCVHPLTHPSTYLSIYLSGSYCIHFELRVRLKMIRNL